MVNIKLTFRLRLIHPHYGCQFSFLLLNCMATRNFNRIFLETVPVIIGILIAVVINNIQQRYADKQYLKSTISSIRAQNQENIRELEYALSRQDVLLDTLKSYLSDNTPLFELIGRGKGLYTPDLKSTTWKFLMDGRNHTLVSYETISQLSEIEKYEDLVRGYNATVKDILFDVEVFENPKMKKVLWIWLQDFRAVEKQMILELNKFDSLTSVH